ncbi:MAG: hypothetical protein U1E26_04065 [Coriobacteriia bacterium]|nr:hypothetical protein [Coriobacteriia bacterium]
MDQYAPPTAPLPPQGYRNDPEYVAYLEQRIAALESRIPKSNLISPKFWTRAWAVYGHMLSVGLLLYAVMFGVYLIAALLIGGTALLSNW